MHKIFIILFFLLGTSLANGQESSARIVEIGADFQKYPTGVLIALRAEFSLKRHHAIDTRIGYNGLDHLDFGVHDSEIGGGFGGSLGYRYYFKDTHSKWFIGARVDLWNNVIDWIDLDPNTEEPIAEGVSDVFVLQPTAVFGYHWLFHEHFALTPTVAAGAEINIITDGAEVGQGLILLLGANFTYRF